MDTHQNMGKMMMVINFNKIDNDDVNKISNHAFQKYHCVNKLNETFIIYIYK